MVPIDGTRRKGLVAENEQSERVTAMTRSLCLRYGEPWD
jgi:hypothetical protein